MALSAKRPSQKERLLAEVTTPPERKKRLNAEVEAELYQRIKLQAVREDRSISDITRTLWIEYLRTHSLE